MPLCRCLWVYAMHEGLGASHGNPTFRNRTLCYPQFLPPASACLEALGEGRA